MPRQPIPLLVDDVSAFARALSAQWRDATEQPGHLTLMNMLARVRVSETFSIARDRHAQSAVSG